MKKVFKKIVLGSLSLAVAATALSLSVAAEKLSDYAKSDYPVENLITNGDLVINTRRLQTLFNGNTEKMGSGPHQLFEWDNHTTYWADFNVGDSVKVISFQSSDSTSWHNMTTMQAAKAWEKANPGWKVYAGINGDFFDIDGSKAPTGICMVEGDLYQPTVGEDNAIGWKADGSFIFGQPKSSSSMYVCEYGADGNITSTVEVSAVNPTAVSNSGISLFFEHNIKNVDLTGAKILQGDFEIYRLNKHGKYFVKGAISKEITTSSITEGYEGHYYLVSKDDSVSKYSVGTKVKVEHKLLNEWADVIQASGCGAQVLINGVPQDQGGNADYTTHPRTMVGIRKDGSIVFLTVDGRGRQEDWEIGASCFQEGELLRLLGCVDGYNLDGGGSTTLIYRNLYGDLEVANRPSDGSERSDGNHLFLVKKDPGFKVSIDNNYSESTVNFKINDEACFNALKNVKVTINNETKDYNAAGVKFSGLDLDTTYSIKVSYQIPSITDSSKYLDDYFEAKFDTQKFEAPYVNFYVSDIGKSVATIHHDGGENVFNIQLNVNGFKYSMGSEKDYVITDLIEDSDQEVSISFDYQDKNNADLKVRETICHVELDPITFHTILFDPPSIVSFEENKVGGDYVKVEYKFTDEGEILEEAYISVNGEKIALDQTKLSGSYKIEELDLANKQYKIKLVLRYDTKVIESKELTYGTESTTDPVVGPVVPTPKAGCNKNSAALIISMLSAFSVAYIILKKRA